MGNVTEIQQAKAWIYSALHANVDIAAAVDTRIYADYVLNTPTTRVYPYILFGFLASSDVDAVGTSRLLSKPLFQVRVVTDGRPDATARTIDKRIDTVLQNAVNQLSGDYYFSARREQSIDRSELDTSTGRQYGNIGGIYRLYIARTP